MERKVKIAYQPKVCRCCLIAIGTWDLTQQYENPRRVSEVFSDMLKECFGFALSHLNEDVYSHYICDQCATRLRDANDFRQQVLTAELTFVQCIDSMNYVDPALPTSTVVKIEVDVTENDLDMVVESEVGLEEVNNAQDVKKEVSDTISETQEKKKTSKLHEKKLKKSKIKVENVPIEIKIEPVDTYLPENENLEGDNDTITKSENKCSDKKAEIVSSEEIKRRSRLTFENTILYRSIRENAALLLKYSTIVPFRNLRFTNGKYTCQYCDVSYIQIDDLRSHIEDNHAEITIPEIISSMKSSVFKPTKAEISRIKCKLCASDFENLEQLVEHLVNVHEKTYHDANYTPQHGILGFLIHENPKCSVCAKEFPFFQALVAHMSEHGSEELKCDKCGKKFFTRLRLRMHKYKCNKDHENNTRTWKCKFCDEVFTKISLKQNHMKTEHHYGWLKCSECGESFLHHKQRSRHMVSAHNYKTPEFTCSECPKVFTTASNLRGHMKTHGDNKIFECEICKLKVTSKHSLTIHMRVHTGERPYACQFCEKMFKSYSALDMHERGHLNDKRYVCQLCDTKFVQINSLKRHYRSQHPDSGVDLTNIKAIKVD